MIPQQSLYSARAVLVGVLLALLAILPAQLPAHAKDAALPMLELHVELDPARRQLDGAAKLQLPAGEFRFELLDSLQAHSAELAGKALPVHAGGRRDGLRSWTLTLPRAGEVKLRYGGTVAALDRALDHRDVVRALPAMAAPEGSYLPGGSGWYPQPSAPFAYRVEVVVPADQRAIVPGRLAAETLPTAADARYRARFDMRHASAGIELMAGPWQVRERRVARAQGEALRLRTYFPAALDAEDGLADAYLDDSARYIERYSKLIGAYPYDGFAVVAGPLPTGFGMPALTYIGEQVLRLPFIRASSLGHEVLHNWWGNGVRVDYASGNWSEGLTTFMADYAYAEQQSAASARAMRLGWLRDFAALPLDAERPLAHFRARTHGAAAAVGYGKAAMVFVMLRDRIGDAAFERGIRLFWEGNRHRVAGWAQLQSAFEKASGQKLGDFFSQWLTRAGAPDLTVEAARLVGEGRRRAVHIDFSQAAPPYQLRVPVQLIAGEDSTTRWVELSGEREEVVIALGDAAVATPQALRVDADLRVWRRPEAAQLPPILRQWILAREPRLAVPARASGETRQAAAALAERLFERPAQAIGTAALTKEGGPVLLVGLHEDIDAALAEAGLPPRPTELGERGSAQVWTVRAERGAALAVVSARDAAALSALQRPLPHYGGQSWLLFDGATVLERGIWPAPGTSFAIKRAD